MKSRVFREFFNLPLVHILRILATKRQNTTILFSTTPEVPTTLIIAGECTDSVTDIVLASSSMHIRLP